MVDLEFIQIIILIVVLVLVPIVPAFLLYWFLPNKTVVNGPFKGMTIKLQGAFAGYFITLIFISGFCLTALSIRSKYQLWTVEGTIRLNDEGRNIGRPQILVEPPNQSIYPNGRFFIRNILLKTNKKSEKPSLIVNKEGYEVETLILDKFPTFIEDGFKNYSIKYLPKDKIIRIEKPIILERKPTMNLYNEDEALVAKPIEGGVK